MLIGQERDRPARLDELIPPALAARLDRLDVLSRKVFAGRMPGERRSKRRGQSAEFDDFRRYTAGDDLRHVDWNVFARLDRLVIKLFKADEDLAVHIVLDASRSMEAGSRSAGPGTPGRPSKLVMAARLAMALGYVSLVNQNRVIFSVIGREPGPPRRLAPMRGRRNLDRLSAAVLGALAPPEDRETAVDPMPLPEALVSVGRSASGRGVLVLLSDLLVRDGLERGLNALAAGGSGGFDTHLVRVLSPSEIDPSSDGRGLLAGDLRLTDVETRRASEVTVTPGLLRRYQERFAAHEAWVMGLAKARDMRMTRVTCDQDPAAVVLGPLRTGRLVGA